MKLYEHKVQFYETDKMGIAHHSNFIRWMEEARVDFLSQIGWDFTRLEALGVVSPVTSVECRYKTPAHFSETIRIAVAVEIVKSLRLRVRYTMTNPAGKLVCEATSEHCFLNREGVPLRLERELPEFCEALRRNGGTL